MPEPPDALLGRTTGQVAATLGWEVEPTRHLLGELEELGLAVEVATDAWALSLKAQADLGGALRGMEAA